MRPEHIGILRPERYARASEPDSIRADLAGGDRKAEYVALSNTIIGVLLLAMGLLTGVLLGLGLEIGILSLSILSLLGAAVALIMKPLQD